MEKFVVFFIVFLTAFITHLFPAPAYAIVLNEYGDLFHELLDNLRRN